jgi:hypothetical protein
MRTEIDKSKVAGAEEEAGPFYFGGTWPGARGFFQRASQILGSGELADRASHLWQSLTAEPALQTLFGALHGTSHRTEKLRS